MGLMKLSVAIAGENALPSAFVVWRGLEQSIKKAAKYGYHGVELALRAAADVNPVHLYRWLDQSKLEVSCISTGQVFAASGLYFTHTDKEIREQAIRVFSELIILAKDFGKTVNIGRARGFIADGNSQEEAEELFLDTTKYVCEVAEKYDVTLILEPVNRYELNFINNLDEGSELLSKIQSDKIGLMPDVFHMNIEDDQIGESLIRNARLIKYIHLADSNRLAPGKGHLDFDEIFNSLRIAQFDGWASIEILPLPDPDTAAMQAAEFILPKIQQYNFQKEGKL